MPALQKKAIRQSPTLDRGKEMPFSRKDRRGWREDNCLNNAEDGLCKQTVPTSCASRSAWSVNKGIVAISPCQTFLGFPFEGKLSDEV